MYCTELIKKPISSIIAHGWPAWHWYIRNSNNAIVAWGFEKYKKEAILEIERYLRGEETNQVIFIK
uniref:Uncharacterized protein n=1 Tax=viral metagenome TaxID=1070528 RepID=A0A6M3JV45_9ZZZZ